MSSNKRSAEKKDPSKSASNIDLKEITQIVDLMEKKGLSVFHWERGGMVLKLKRGCDVDVLRDVLGRMAVPAAASAAPAAAPSGSAETPASEPMGPTVNSPMVGTFYRASAPGEKPFVNMGDVVDENSVVCIIEAMKVMNEIKAEMRGVIARVLVEDGKPVQYGQPLFELKA